ncbi:MAG: ribonuclease E/G [Rhodovibrionaceae bacterium]
MTGKLLVARLPGELRAVRLDRAGRLQDLRIERGGPATQAGSLYRGRIARIDRALAAAFVDLGEDLPGFLPLDKAPEGVTEGTALCLKVTRAPSPGKGAKLSAKGVPQSDGPAPALLQAAAGLEAWLTAQERAPEETGACFPEAVEAEIETLLQPEVTLPGGGRLIVEPVSSMTAIDVDSGSDARGALEIDLAAAAEIPRQLRLRNLSGLIVVDFLGLERRDARRQVTERLTEGCAADREPVELSAMSASGLVEIARRRAAPALHEIMFWPPHRRRQPLSLAYDALRGFAAAPPAPAAELRLSHRLAAALRGPAGEALAALEARRGHSLVLIEEAWRDDDSYELVIASRP